MPLIRYIYLAIRGFLLTPFTIRFSGISPIFFEFSTQLLGFLFIFGRSSIASANLNNFGIFECAELIEVKSKSCNHH